MGLQTPTMVGYSLNPQGQIRQITSREKTQARLILLPRQQPTKSQHVVIQHSRLFYKTTTIYNGLLYFHEPNNRFASTIQLSRSIN